MFLSVKWGWVTHEEKVICLLVKVGDPCVCLLDVVELQYGASRNL